MLESSLGIDEISFVIGPLWLQNGALIWLARLDLQVEAPEVLQEWAVVGVEIFSSQHTVLCISEVAMAIKALNLGENNVWFGLFNLLLWSFGGTVNIILEVRYLQILILFGSGLVSFHCAIQACQDLLLWKSMPICHTFWSKDSFLKYLVLRAKMRHINSGSFLTWGLSVYIIARKCISTLEWGLLLQQLLGSYLLI